MHLRDVMDFDQCRASSQSFLAERERYERAHQEPGEVVCVATDEIGRDLAQTHAVVMDGYCDAKDELPDETDHVARLQDCGLPERDANAIEEAGIWTIAQLRQHEHEICDWHQCGHATAQNVRRALGKLDRKRKERA